MFRRAPRTAMQTYTGSAVQNRGIHRLIRRIRRPNFDVESSLDGGAVGFLGAGRHAVRPALLRALPAGFVLEHRASDGKPLD